MNEKFPQSEHVYTENGGDYFDLESTGRVRFPKVLIDRAAPPPGPTYPPLSRFSELLGRDTDPRSGWLIGQPIIQRALGCGRSQYGARRNGDLSYILSIGTWAARLDITHVDSVGACNSAHTLAVSSGHSIGGRARHETKEPRPISVSGGSLSTLK